MKLEIVSVFELKYVEKVMNIKKFIFALFIVFSLSFSYQPSALYSKEKEMIVVVLDYRQDDLTREFLKANETKRFSILVSLSLRILMEEPNQILINNTS